MTKLELENKMVVEVRNKSLYIIVGDTLLDLSGFMTLSCYKNNLKIADDDCGEFDIMKVYYYNNEPENVSSLREMLNKNKQSLKLIWERINYKLTKKDVITLRALQTLGFNFIQMSTTNKGFNVSETKHFASILNDVGYIPIKQKSNTLSSLFSSSKMAHSISDILNSID